MKQTINGIEYDIGPSADLQWADLRGADLHWATLRRTNLILFQFNQHRLIYTGDDKIRIGCEHKTITEWLESYEIVGKKHEYTNEEIKMYGAVIKMIADKVRQGDEI
jgi:uncharacterized protein YjbI with pentapeptide repeats